MRKVKSTTINLIKQFEGCNLHSYKALSTEKEFTIGYGHYGVKGGLTITQKQAEEYLKKDLEQCAKYVNKYDSQYHWSQNEFDALCSFLFNIGVGTIHTVTNRGTRTKYEVSKAILLYNKSGGKCVQGLINRRNAEYNLFIKNCYLVNTISTGLNLREEPHTQSRILVTIPKGDLVRFHSDGYTNWTRVEYDDKIGYCASQYLKKLKGV